MKIKKFELTKEQAIELYNGADASTKTSIEKMFGKQAFVPEKAWEKIKTFKDAYTFLKIKTYGNAYKLLKLKRKAFASTPISGCDDEALILYIIILAINGGKMPKMSDRRYYPWYNVSSGFVFGDADCVVDGATSASASRLCFFTEESSIYGGKQFLREFKTFVDAHA